MAKRRPVHPGDILSRELESRGLSASRLALALRVPTTRITAILNGKRGISADTALRLARFFGNGAKVWMDLQTCYELETAELTAGKRIRAEVQVGEANP